MFHYSGEREPSHCYTISIFGTNRLLVSKLEFFIMTEFFFNSQQQEVTVAVKYYLQEMNVHAS